jgi:hypothetical protein
MHFHSLELTVEHQPEEESQRADDQAAQEQRPAVNAAEEADLREIGDYEVRFAACFVLDLNGLRRSSCGGSKRAVRTCVREYLSAGGIYSNGGKKRQNEIECAKDDSKLPIHS